MGNTKSKHNLVTLLEEWLSEDPTGLDYKSFRDAKRDVTIHKVEGEFFVESGYATIGPMSQEQLLMISQKSSALTFQTPHIRASGDSVVCTTVVPPGDESTALETENTLCDEAAIVTCDDTLSVLPTVGPTSGSKKGHVRQSLELIEIKNLSKKNMKKKKIKKQDLNSLLSFRQRSLKERSVDLFKGVSTGGKYNKTKNNDRSSSSSTNSNQISFLQNKRKSNCNHHWTNVNSIIKSGYAGRSWLKDSFVTEPLDVSKKTLRKGIKKKQRRTRSEMVKSRASRRQVSISMVKEHAAVSNKHVVSVNRNNKMSKSMSPKLSRRRSTRVSVFDRISPKPRNRRKSSETKIMNPFAGRPKSLKPSLSAHRSSKKVPKSTYVKNCFSEKQDNVNKSILFRKEASSKKEETKTTKSSSINRAGDITKEDSRQTKIQNKVVAKSRSTCESKGVAKKPNEKKNDNSNKTSHVTRTREFTLSNMQRTSSRKTKTVPITSSMTSVGRCWRQGNYSRVKGFEIANLNTNERYVSKDKNNMSSATVATTTKAATAGSVTLTSPVTACGSGATNNCRSVLGFSEPIANEKYRYLAYAELDFSMWARLRSVLKRLCVGFQRRFNCMVYLSEEQFNYRGNLYYMLSIEGGDRLSVMKCRNSLPAQLLSALVLNDDRVTDIEKKPCASKWASFLPYNPHVTSKGESFARKLSF